MNTTKAKILELKANGLSQVVIAKQLGIQRSTVAYHLGLRKSVKKKPIREMIEEIHEKIVKSGDTDAACLQD